MTPNDLLTYAGTAATTVAAFVLVRASWQTQTTRVWREEAEAQRTRADRLQSDMDEIKARLTRIEAENQRLIQLLTALDPERVAAHRA
ncbi:hypothetical protein [Streptomyces noursei]|uniref:hypothetical protein n=1 Tax=Streptomyces noursei TaxID=1971 RepID=UPI0019A4F11C|nr:hypothetical protein [Streptomyces noursei]MCZ1015622.1 hypothetical protein [Streptomyces noursei]GGW89526.1 hypothetical protein GCM10010341_07950 [Streptomyces noursei]